MKRMAFAKRPAAAGLFLLLILTATLNAQTPTEAWEGTVTGDDVFIRSGPVVNAQPITQVDAGQKVTVIDQRPGWYGIKPLAGCYSVVKADYVRPDAQGKIGTINSDNVLVRAAGRKQLANKNFNTPQSKLNTGDRVRIIGSVFNADRSAVQWYVIKPPDRVRFWISANYVKRAPTEVSAAPDDTAMTPVDRTQPAPVEPAETPEVAPTPAQSPGPGLSLREEVELRRKLQAVETLLNAELKKPVAERDLKPLIEQAQAINVPTESRFQSQYQTLLTYMQSEQTQIRKYREAQELVETVLAGETPAPAPQPETPPAAPKAYDLRGHLQFSKLPPTTAGNRTFVVRMPGSDVVRGYATSSENADLTAYVGRVVGLRGAIAYDATIAADVLRVNEVELLDDAGPIAAPPVEPPMDIEPPSPVDTEFAVQPSRPGPAELDDPAIADLLEPIELPEPQPQETPDPSPLEAGMPAMGDMEPVAAAPDRATQEPPAAPEPPADPQNLDADLPEPTAPEPSRPSMASAPAQPDIAPPVAPIETQPIEPPTEAEPVAVTPEPAAPEPPVDTEPVAVTPEPVAPEPPADTEPVAVMPEPVAPEPPADTAPVAVMPEPVAPEPPADTEPVAVTPEPVAPEPPADTEPVAVTPEPVAPEPPVDTEPVAVMPEPVAPEPPADTAPVAVMPEPVAPEPPAEPDETEDFEPVAIGIEPVQPEPIDSEPAEAETTDIEPIAIEPTETEPDETDTEPVETTPIETVQLDPDADDVTEGDDWGSIRPVSVDPVDIDAGAEDIEIAIAEDEPETPAPAEVEGAPEAPATAPPVVVPAPRHGSPMPEEVLVTPDGYEVEYD
jgi:hypothetical protein